MVQGKDRDTGDVSSQSSSAQGHPPGMAGLITNIFGLGELRSFFFSVGNHIFHGTKIFHCLF